MQHSEPFENEALMSDEDHLTIKLIGKCMVSSMIIIMISLSAVCIIN